MNRWRCWSLVVCSLVTACGSKANPAFSCSDSPCTDPNFPYCDVDGSVGGIPEACTAVTCTAGAFQSCRGDNIALTCNNSGTSFDEVQCAHGCDAATGCKLCEASQTVCQNGVVATCDASGAQTSTTHCPLGCFEDQPRCRDIDPSNGLAQYLDIANDPSDFEVPADKRYSIDTSTGMVMEEVSGGMQISAQTFLMAAPVGGVPVRVLVARNVNIAGRLDVGSSSIPRDDVGGEAFAIIATEELVIDGHLVGNGAGSVKDASCNGGMGDDRDSASQGVCAASGGGGFATPGADGGAITAAQGFGGGAGGGVCGNSSLIPLRGGGPAGGLSVDDGVSAPTVIAFGGSGGGAIQLVSRKRILINGVVNVDGITSGFGQVSAHGLGVGGGGAGGGLLLEAPAIAFTDGAMLLARGGAGDANGLHPAQTESGNAMPGIVCGSGTGVSCGNGGSGATVGISAQAGGAAANNGFSVITSGGGGGGLGRIRINTPDGTYSKANTVIEAGALTTGTLKTR